jgi:hypothetical protein
MWNVNVRGVVVMEAKKNELLAHGCTMIEVTTIFCDWYGITFNKPSKPGK